MKWIFTMALSHHHIQRCFSSFILSLQLLFDSGRLGSPSPPGMSIQCYPLVPSMSNTLFHFLWIPFCLLEFGEKTEWSIKTFSSVNSQMTFLCFSKSLYGYKQAQMKLRISGSMDRKRKSNMIFSFPSIASRVQLLLLLFRWIVLKTKKKKKRQNKTRWWFCWFLLLSSLMMQINMFNCQQYNYLP